jgi:hypothetical protein
MSKIYVAELRMRFNIRQKNKKIYINLIELKTRDKPPITRNIEKLLIFLKIIILYFI